jgi:hypothetical protein
MKVKLLIDLKDSYNETYHHAGDMVDIKVRSIDTEPDGVTVGHIRKYPYQCGWFYIKREHFKKIKK